MGTPKIRHVVVLMWKEATAPRQVDALCEALSALPAEVPEIRAYQFGPDAGISTGNGDFGIVADFDDEEAYLRYASHPAHVRVIEQFVKPIVAARSAVQIEI